MRLLVRVLVCILAGSVIVSGLQVVRGSTKVNGLFYAVAAGALILLGLTLHLVQKPWVLETFVRRLVLLMVCFYGGFLLCAWTQKLAGPPHPSVIQLLVTGLSFQGATLLLVWLFLREQSLSWSEAFGFSNRPVHGILFGIILACVFFPVGFQLQRVSVKTIMRLSREKPEEQQAMQAFREADSVPKRVVFALVTLLLAPAAEEMLFRGILYQSIKQAGFPRLALWGTSLLFAGVHMNFPIFLPLFVLALALTLLYERTNNLLAPIAAHSCFNAMNLAALLLMERLAGAAPS